MTSFLSWKRTLDELKAKAIAQTDEDPRPTETALSLAKEAVQKGIVASMPSLRAAARSGAAAGLDPTQISGMKPAPVCTIYGWRLCLSRTRVPDGRYSWHFSASLSPRERSTSDRDWKTLGKIARHVGAPPDPLVVPDDPRDVHHWQWFEQ